MYEEYEECKLYRLIKNDREAMKELMRLLKDSYWATAEIDRSSLCCDEDIYIALSQIIPKNRIIYDFGASYGVQSWLFRKHKKYIGIDLATHGDAKSHFNTTNSEWHAEGIGKFLEEHEIPQESFAICNYVPPWDKEALKTLRLKCPHLYINYPVGNDYKEYKERRSAMT